MSNTGSSGDMIQSPISLPVPVVRDPNSSQEQLQAIEPVNAKATVSPRDTPIIQERVCKVYLSKSPEHLSPRKVLHFKRIGCTGIFSQIKLHNKTIYTCMIFLITRYNRSYKFMKEKAQ